MPCFKPLSGWRGIGGGVSFNPKTAYVDQPMTVPCGQCIGCRADRAKEWAVRCVHEAQTVGRSCFVTLTYSEENIPSDGSVNKRDVQLFIKRLRKRFSGHRISYFGCGEYGSDLGRPHYHLLLFGVDFDDKTIWKESGQGTLYRSKTLETLWPVGFTTIGPVTYQTAAYTARYSLKKITGERAISHYGGKSPEFLVCSTKPAIGGRWALKYLSDTYPSDTVIASGRAIKVPRYYDKLLKRNDADLLKEMKTERRIEAHQPKRIWNNTASRLAVRETVAKSKLSLTKRSFES